MLEVVKFLLILFIIGFITYLILLYMRLFGFITILDIILRFFDVITIIVQPTVPLCIMIGLSFSIKKLKSVNIFCITPNKILTGGWVDQICFDKTGTLT